MPVDFFYFSSKEIYKLRQPFRLPLHLYKLKRKNPMSYAAAIIIYEKWRGINVAQFVKIGLNYVGQFMVQEENEKTDRIDPQDLSFLRDLIQRSRNGDSQAMEAIYERFNRPIFNLVYRHINNRETAEDLLQDIFLKIFINLQNLKKEETFVSWLYRIAINSCYSHLRGRKSQLRRAIPLSEVEEKIGERTSLSGDKILRKSLDGAIQSLPGKLKTNFLLHDVQGFKHKEITRMLGCSVGTSKSQLFKARKRIRERLKNEQVI